MDSLTDSLIPFISPVFEWLSVKWPFIAQFFFAVGMFRTFFKPIFSAIEKAVADTASKRDDKILEDVKSSRAFKAFAWFLDYTTSIKLPVRK